MAKGSCGEVRNKIHLARRLGFITDPLCEKLIKEVKLLGNQIGQLMKKVKDKINSGKKAPKPITHNP